jgi:hypothetical protein
MLLDSSSEVSSVMNVKVAVSEVEAETAKTEGQIISVNSGHIVRAEGNR